MTSDTTVDLVSSCTSYSMYSRSHRRNYGISFVNTFYYELQHQVLQTFSITYHMFFGIRGCTSNIFQHIHQSCYIFAKKIALDNFRYGNRNCSFCSSCIFAQDLVFTKHQAALLASPSSRAEQFRRAGRALETDVLEPRSQVNLTSIQQKKTHHWMSNLRWKGQKTLNNILNSELQ